jgi:RNA polymerase sigma-70 factor (ECF subfamily)
MGRLSAQEREALLLVAWEGLEPARAARAAGCSGAAFRWPARSSWSRAVRALRRRSARSWLAMTRRATPDSHGSGSSPRESSLRQATRNVSAITSSDDAAGDRLST